jgi:predicted O-methyltransferase YrrM
MFADGFARTPRLKGLPFHRFLQTLHRERAVKRYLEIGTHEGASLSRATGRAIAIDPDFQLDRRFGRRNRRSLCSK